MKYLIMSLFLCGPAFATELSVTHHSSFVEPIEPEHSCAIFCVFAGDGTRAVPSKFAARGHVGSSSQFERELSSSDTAGQASWNLVLQTTLRRSALSGNTLFAFYDADEPHAVQQHQVTALYQAPVKGGKVISAKLQLSPDEGFRSGHTYRLQIIQLVAGKEQVLGEGDISLK